MEHYPTVEENEICGEMDGDGGNNAKGIYPNPDRQIACVPLTCGSWLEGDCVGEISKGWRVVEHQWNEGK